MKAAVFHGKGDIRVDSNYPIPRVGDHQVLLRVKACGVCGTDVHIHAGAQGATDCNPPVILGHEFAGEVVEAGSCVTRIKPGDHITVNDVVLAAVACIALIIAADGELRLYSLMGLLAGFLIYMGTLHPLLIQLFRLASIPLRAARRFLLRLSLVKKLLK